MLVLHGSQTSADAQDDDDVPMTRKEKLAMWRARRLAAQAAEKEAADAERQVTACSSCAPMLVSYLSGSKVTFYNAHIESAVAALLYWVHPLDRSLQIPEGTLLTRGHAERCDSIRSRYTCAHT